MDEVENTINEIPEVVTPETENHDTTVTPDIQVEDAQEKNWREIRRKNKQLEDELKLQRELMQQLITEKQKVPEIDEFDAIDDEEFIPKGKVKKLVSQEAHKIAQEAVRSESEKMMKQQDQARFLDKLRNQFTDFEDVVNVETLSLLEEQEPELANTIAELKDPYKIGIQAYKYIKAMNIVSKVPTSRRAKEVEKKLEKNSKTIQTPQAYEKRPMAQAFKLTETEKKALYEEMYNCASQAGFGY